AAARAIVPRFGGDLLNVTLRSVRTDTDTLLRYADRDLTSVVMFFSQAQSDGAETRMREMTVALVDASLAEGGRYYLPYRLHPTRAQFQRAYPQAERGFALKKQYDPDL